VHGTLRVAPRWAARVTSGADVLALADAGQPIHDTPRNLVLVTQAPGARLVVKRSRRQERSRWIRVTSLWRPGEGVRGFDLLARLAADGLPVPEPVAAFDTRHRGLVVASHLVYAFVEGEPCTCADAPAIALVLRAMHARGWVHGDPHARNFLHARDGVVLLDCVSARRRATRFARAYDFVLLRKCCPGWRPSAEAGLEEDAWFRLAALGSRTMVAWRWLKARLRPHKGVRS
jgi:tRNA A-37 threonylcarbamoyl transferase component Bud32